MVDYSRELRSLRDMHDTFLRTYGGRNHPSDEELAEARKVRSELNRVWRIAILTSCEESEDELLRIGEDLEVLSSRKGYKL